MILTFQFHQFDDFAVSVPETPGTVEVSHAGDLTAIFLDDTQLPNFFVHEVHASGVFKYSWPIITWILDRKILHESHYNQDYRLPWSYQLGPKSVTELTKRFNQVKQKIELL